MEDMKTEQPRVSVQKKIHVCSIMRQHNVTDKLKKTIQNKGEKSMNGSLYPINTQYDQPSQGFSLNHT